MKKLIVRSQRTSSGTVVHHLRVEGVQDINDLRMVYNDLLGAREKIHYHTKFYNGTLELVVGNVDINQLLETGGYVKAEHYIMA